MMAAVASLALIGPIHAADAPNAPATANRNQEALDLALRLGHEWSVEGLEAMVDSGNADLIGAYARGFRATAMSRSRAQGTPHVALPEGIESLIVAHYADQKVGPALLELIRASSAHYRTRALFDLLLADWRSGRHRAGSLFMRDIILYTDAEGIEPQLLEALKAMNGEDGGDGTGILYFLGARHYAPAVPVFADMLRRAKPDGARSLTDVMVTRLGTPQAIDAVLGRLAWLRDQSPSTAVLGEISFIEGKLAALPPDKPLDYAVFRKSLPATLDADQRSMLLALVANRKEKAGYSEIVPMLGEPKLYVSALNALVDSDSPDIWRKARAEIERLKREGQLDEGRYAYASRLLDEKITRPERHFAEKRERERAVEFEARSKPLVAELRRVQALQTRDPERYVEEAPAALQRLDALATQYVGLPPADVGLRGELANEYLNVGNVVRFRLRQPRRALDFYLAAQAQGSTVAALALGDLYQFDLRDSAKALAAYRAQLDGIKKKSGTTNDIEAGIAMWLSRWLGAQIEYLEDGKRFRGDITDEDLGVPAFMLAYGGGSPAWSPPEIDALKRAVASAFARTPQGAGIDRRDLAAKLERLPASAFMLAQTAALATLLPDAPALLAYLEKHDPAGYGSASFFGLATRRSEVGGSAVMLPGLALDDSADNPVRIAAARFLRERQVRLVLGADPRMATPVQTWQLLIDALKRGDIPTASSCLTPGQQAKFRPGWERMSPAQLRILAESFTGFQVTGSIGDDMVEAIAVRGKRGGMVQFIRIDGAWKIGEM
jgi:hypothetical protein